MKKVMIVDDAAFMRMLLRNILVTDQFEVVAEATNGLEAVEMYQIHQPDIVTMDITMPEMDGVVALKEILKMDQDAKVCMVSAMGQDKIILESVKSGAKDFIVKPFEAAIVLEKMKKISA